MLGVFNIRGGRGGGLILGGEKKPQSPSGLVRDVLKVVRPRSFGICHGQTEMYVPVLS